MKFGGGSSELDAFIARWQGREGGQERANYQLFLSELCDALGVKRPDPAGASSETNDYVFERVVKEPQGDGTHANRRIDLYKRGSFVLEAKQSRQAGGDKEIPGQHDMFGGPQVRGRRGVERAWDVLMMNARRQAEGYARALPVAHGWPPFILVCDVGHCIEVYADFSGQGKNYAQFPDRQSYRIFLEDLRDEKTRERLVAIWNDPQSLDPSRHSAKVTREIAERLAAVSKHLEKSKHPPEDVAMFLMRCLFTMFAEDVGLLPEKSFRDLLRKCEDDPSKFPLMVGQLWDAMNDGGFAYAIEAHVKRFNGEFFARRSVLHLGREEIGELRQAAEADWRDVEPAIFGALLEQALDEKERKRLGAHYTPRAYVERLVIATIMEPLRRDWAEALATAERQNAEGRRKEALATLGKFHDRLCRLHVLDPACGTGNFLYAALELLKRLEGEVLEAITDLGGQEALKGLEGHTVDPHQFLGLEINTRAAAIAELVLWIGYLQWHFRTRGGSPAEPILRAFRNIEVKDAVLDADRELARDERGKPLERRTADGGTESVYLFRKPRIPDWPAADFIVGNPPFMGGKDIRNRLGDGYAEALWSAHPHMNESADFVMYWWDRAADLLTRKGTLLRRFGLVTTNSISQVFQRRVMERHLNAKRPISLVMAIPDHPWTKATKDAAAVRIAMTVAEAGSRDGILREAIGEAGLDTDQPRIEFRERAGTINADLTIGVNLSHVQPLKANDGLCSRGVSLHGAGFIVTRQEAEHLGLGKRPGLDKYIREYRNGRDLTSRARGAMVIDFFGLDAEEVRSRFPEVYQHLLGTVRPERQKQRNKSPTKDAEAYLAAWWIFGKPRTELRPALEGLPRYIATVETTKHRIFQFLDHSILPDNMLVAIAHDDPYILGVLSSKAHVIWTLNVGGTLEDRPRYTKSHCFDPFPFPVVSVAQRALINAIAEELDAHRKRRLADHPKLTLTGLYNVLERLRAGTPPDQLSSDERVVFDDGLVLILKELHDRLDIAVAEAYGWAADLAEEEVLARLVALNRERAEEETRGNIRWLRPAFQEARFGMPAKRGQQIEADLEIAASAAQRPRFPTDEVAQTAAVMSALAGSTAPLDPNAIAAGFKQGRKIKPKVETVLAALARMGFVSTSGKAASARYHLPRGI